MKKGAKKQVVYTLLFLAGMAVMYMWLALNGQIVALM